MTIPKRLREAYDLDEGDEVRWLDTDAGIVVRKATRSAGRGLLVDDESSAEQREAMAEALEAEIRERRRTDWTPE